MQKIKITSQLILRYSGNRQTDGRTDTTDRTTFPANAVSNYARAGLPYIYTDFDADLETGCFLDGTSK